MKIGSIFGRVGEKPPEAAPLEVSMQVQYSEMPYMAPDFKANPRKPFDL